MAIKTFKLDERPGNLGICIYGETGAGKTTLLETMPGRGIIIDVPQVEGGTFVLEHASDRITGIRIEDWEELEETYQALYTKDESQIEGVSRAKWVAVDSITGLAELAKRKIIKDRDRDLGGAPHDLTQRERGQIGELVSTFIYRFRYKMPYNAILFIAQRRRIGGGDNDPGGIVRYAPNIQPMALDALKPSMTIIGHLEVAEGRNETMERRLRVGPPANDDYIIKARTPRNKPLPNVIRNPNLGEILRYMFADGKKPRAAKDDVF